MTDVVYSPRRRTALVLTGTGTAGAYHAGVLRALHEAGVKVDLVAGRGIGAAGAVFAAVDGGAPLWAPGGLWRHPAAARAYRWRPALRAAAWLLLATLVVLLSPLALLVAALLVYVGGMILTLVGLAPAGAVLTSGFSRLLDLLFTPGALPTVVPRLAALGLAAMLAVAAAATAASRLRARRRWRGAIWWHLAGAPLTATAIRARRVAALWHLIRGAAPQAAPPSAELGRRYAELVAENLGQPGFRELLVAVHDLDARRDLVFALLAEPHRQAFLAHRGAGREARGAEIVDLAGAGRDHALDALAAALALPLGPEPHLVAFAPESVWRGETHRVCDRPDALVRLLDEAAAAGAEQVILVSALPPPGGPHQLGGARRDLRGRAGECLAAFETAALTDALALAADRFAALFEIRPAHNPLGPLDFGGVYDERSDRRHTLDELVERGYEDAYRQFVDPVVGGSGEALEERRASTAGVEHP
jgi:hypothetical protein